MTPQLHGAARIPEARQIAARYLAGQSIRHIADDLGRSYCYVWHMLNTAGVQRRPRGGQRRKETT